MSESEKDMGPVLSEADDDLPDFSGDEWAAKIDEGKVKRGPSEAALDGRAG